MPRQGTCICCCYPTVNDHDYGCVALYIVLENPLDKTPNHSGSLAEAGRAKDLKPPIKPQLPSNPLGNLLNNTVIRQQLPPKAPAEPRKLPTQTNKPIP